MAKKTSTYFELKYKGGGAKEYDQIVKDIFKVALKEYPGYMRNLKEISKSHAPVKTEKLRDQIRYETHKNIPKSLSGWIRSEVANPIDGFIYSYKMHEGRYNLGKRSASETPTTGGKFGGSTGRSAVGPYYLRDPLYALAPHYFDDLAKKIGQYIKK